ncbi:bifunctional nicotinamidase/pyrazinamidase [Breoghania sp.]|uniref:bifunctional nicotinamidase/pyrazinamidase n=1 Tax=Breoghania sp. TaxID=2065378 RepID=UPI0026238FA4|nr:bifunctional nicotinamidase/pyrazinamidase [Breoghania sp.]MDJ0932967.1 bifunctional nicotinamidase/pyrazinamidase [Breoghania sp.]
MPDIRPTDSDCLVVIDLQNDFIPGGALAVPGGDTVVPVIDDLLDRFDHVVASQDWHPAGHFSFASAQPEVQPYDTIAAAYGPQTVWPDHCVQGTEGADFHPDFRIERAELILRKGYRREIDSYSAFFENDRETPTGLAGYLRERGFKRLFFCGLATDFCVRWSVEDAVKEGFDTVLIEDACRAIDLDGSLNAALAAMDAAGAIRIASSEIAA